MLQALLDELFAAGAEETANNLAPMAIGAAVGAAVGAGTTYALMRHHKVNDRDAVAIFGKSELKLDRAALSDALLADVLDAQNVGCGLRARGELVSALTEFRTKHGVAATNVALRVLASTVSFDSVVGAKPTADSLLKLAGPTLVDFVGVETIEKLPESLLKSEDARDLALVEALKHCFAAKQYVRVATPKAES